MPTAMGLWLVLAASSPDECREAYAAVTYREAARLCLDALKTAQPVELAGIYRLAGLSFAALDDETQALKLFLSLLALDPSARLDPSISPKQRAPFERALALRAGAPVRLELKATKDHAIEVTVNDGPERPVVALTAQQDALPPARLERHDRNVVELGDGARRISVSAYDAFGGALASAALELRPRVRLSWKPWAVIAGVTLALATGAAVASRVLYADATHPQLVTDAQRKLDFSHGTAVGADIGFVLAGALAVTSLVIGLLAL